MKASSITWKLWWSPAIFLSPIVAPTTIALALPNRNCEASASQHRTNQVHPANPKGEKCRNWCHKRCHKRCHQFVTSGGSGGSGGSFGGSHVGNDVGSLSVVQLTETQNNIIKMIKEDPFISTQKMSVIMSVVPRTVKRSTA